MENNVVLVNFEMMEEKLIEEIKKHICKDFLQPENSEDCKMETDHDCMCCAKDFIDGWNAHKGIKK